MDLRRLATSEADTWDALQDTWLRVFRAIRTLRDPRTLPAFLYNIGQCYRNLGDLDQAIFSFKKYLKLDPEAENKEAVERLIDDLEDQKARGEGEKFMRDKREADAKPVYKKWWFWTGVGAVVVAGVVTAVLIANSGVERPPCTASGGCK